MTKKTNDFSKPDPKAVLPSEQALGQTLTSIATKEEKKIVMVFSSYTVSPTRIRQNCRAWVRQNLEHELNSTGASMEAILRRKQNRALPLCSFYILSIQVANSAGENDMLYIQLQCSLQQGTGPCDSPQQSYSPHLNDPLYSSLLFLSHKSYLSIPHLENGAFFTLLHGGM